MVCLTELLLLLANLHLTCTKLTNDVKGRRYNAEF
jgi:hypothetical protein